MTLTISPTNPATVAGSAPISDATAVSPATQAGISASAALALAFEQIDAGPLGLRKPAEAEDMAALLSQVEMDLDATSSKTRANSLASGLEIQRSGLLAGAGLQALLQQDQGALGTAQTTLARDQSALAAAQAETGSARDDAAITALANQVAIDTDAVNQANATLAFDLGFQTATILSAFANLAHTLQTGDGKFARYLTTSNNLDLGFDALNDAQSGFQSRDLQRTRNAALATGTIQTSDEHRRDDIREVASTLAAGLADVRAVLAELKEQAASAAGSAPTDRVRLPL